MRSTPIGIVMLNDEREHVWKANNRECMEVVRKWTGIIQKGVSNIDGSSPEIVPGSEIITSVQVAQKVGEESCRYRTSANLQGARLSHQLLP